MLVVEAMGVESADIYEDRRCFELQYATGICTPFAHARMDRGQLRSETRLLQVHLVSKRNRKYLSFDFHATRCFAVFIFLGVILFANLNTSLMSFNYM